MGKISSINSGTDRHGIPYDSKVRLVSPGDGANVSGTSITFNWEKVDDRANRYWLRVFPVVRNGRSSGFTQEVKDRTSYTATGAMMEDGVEYYWYVSAYLFNMYLGQSSRRTFTYGTLQTVTVAAVKITNCPGSLEVGKSIQLSAAVSPTNVANKKVNWSVDNPAVASISPDGSLTDGKSAGYGNSYSHLGAKPANKRPVSDNCDQAGG